MAHAGAGALPQQRASPLTPTTRRESAVRFPAVAATLTPFGASTVLDDEVQDKASAAVAGLGFNFEAFDFTVYTVRDEGFHDISFAASWPDSVCSTIYAKLGVDPDITRVLAGKCGPIGSRL